MFGHRVKCAFKLIGALMVYSLPLCVLVASINLTLKYLIKGDASVFSALFKVEYYINLLTVLILIILVSVIVVLIARVDVPDTNIAGYRRFILEKFRN